MANKTTTKKKKTSAKKKTKTSAKPKKNTISYKASSTKKFSKQKPDTKKRKAILVACFSAFVIVIVVVCIIAAQHSGSGNSNRFTEIDKDVAWGIDVSSHNGKINWKKVSGKADFVFVRVGYRGYANGKINLDKHAKANMKGANKYDIPLGVYFYSQAINKKEAVKEAEFLIKHVKDYKITLPLVIDFEYAYKNGKTVGRLHKAKLSRKEKTALINAFCDTVRKAGYTPGVYASSYIYRSHFIMKSIPDDVFIWVADYNKKVTYKGEYDFWQYSETEKCDGVKSKNVDANYFYTKKRLKDD